METGYFFTALVIAIAALNIIWKLVEYTTRIYHASGIRPGSRPATSRRDDWYMFFHRSDLTGKNTDRSSAGKPKCSAKTQKRRDSRPVLRQYLS